eukprot:359539-Chlamydomonas_euryale.AAC.1
MERVSLKTLLMAAEMALLSTRMTPSQSCWQRRNVSNPTCLRHKASGRGDRSAEHECRERKGGGRATQSCWRRRNVSNPTCLRHKASGRGD